MSSKQGEGVVGKVLARVTPASGPEYGCEFCGLTYDSDRLNCPACGGPVEQR